MALAVALASPAAVIATVFELPQISIASPTEVRPTVRFEGSGPQ